MTAQRWLAVIGALGVGGVLLFVLSNRGSDTRPSEGRPESAKIEPKAPHSPESIVVRERTPAQAARRMMRADPFIARAELRRSERIPGESERAYRNRIRLAGALSDNADRANLSATERQRVWAILADAQASYDAGEAACVADITDKADEEFDGVQCMSDVHAVLTDEALQRIADAVGEAKAKAFGRGFVALTVSAGSRVALFEREPNL